MFELKGQSVFMVLYNYSSYDYEVVNINSNLSDAYTYIRKNEYNSDVTQTFDIVEIKDTTDFDNMLVSNDELKICYFKQNNYTHFPICDYDNISSFIIVEMLIR